MNKRMNLRDRWQGLTDTVMRFPLTVLLLVASIVTNVIAIESSFEVIYTKLLITFLLGASIFVVLQLLYERFLENPIFRIVVMLATVISSAIYYILIRNSEWRIDIAVRTIVILFILLIAFLWIPSIQSEITINESIMATFKSFFTALFFDGVLFIGTVIIIGATNLLIFKVSEHAYIHSANIIFLLLAPIYFLSMIPYYPGRKDEDSRLPFEDGASFVQSGQPNSQEPEENSHRDELQRMITPTKFLESLITFVVIPITAVFTIILLLYLIINIRGEFWSDNLTEPMLVSYSVTVIIVYLLSSTIQKPFAKYFRLIFPKVLIPFVVFQTLSSILKITDVGVTYGRYYVILFGLFATVAGILFSFLPIRKNGIIAPILIALSIISILPPVDAFTLSKVNQTARLEKVLTKNNMLNNDTIKPNAKLSEEDKSDLVSAFEYLERMDYIKNIDYLGSYLVSFDFEKTFGFARYGYNDKEYKNYYYSRNIIDPIPISGYDFMTQMSIYNMSEVPKISFEVNGSQYNLHVDRTELDNQIFVLSNSLGQELLRYEYNNIFAKFDGVDSNNELLSTEELTFRQENDKAALTIIANNISVNEWADGKDKSSDLIILIGIR